MHYLQRAKELSEELTADRRHLHQHPEVGMDLPLTTAFVMDRLRSLGCDPQELPHGGVTALIGKPGGKVFLLRADMDALPMEEESGVPYSSRIPGAAHTCGHDMHTAMLLCAARMLKENEGALNGRVKLMFQPGEEVMGGAKSMIADGILESPPVDAALMVHMMPKAPTGQVVFADGGVVSASCDTFRITVTGKGGHGAHPDTAVDPILIGGHLLVAAQELIARETDPNETVVLTMGSFHAGDAHNIIPAEAVMTGTIRAFSEEVRALLTARLTELCEGIASAYRAVARVDYPSSTCALRVDPAVVNVVGPAFQDLLGKEKAFPIKQHQSGSEDFAEITARVPAMSFALGGGCEAEDPCYRYPLHSPKLRYNEACLPVGAACYAHAATEWLRQAD